MKLLLFVMKTVSVGREVEEKCVGKFRFESKVYFFQLDTQEVNLFRLLCISSTVLL